MHPSIESLLLPSILALLQPSLKYALIEVDSAREVDVCIASMVRSRRSVHQAPFMLYRDQLNTLSGRGPCMDCRTRQHSLHGVGWTEDIAGEAHRDETTSSNGAWKSVANTRNPGKKRQWFAKRGRTWTHVSPNGVLHKRIGILLMVLRAGNQDHIVLLYITCDRDIIRFARCITAAPEDRV